MKRLTAWLTGVAGGVAAARIFRRAPTPVPVREPDPADALRAKLAETKSAQPEPEPAAPAKEPDDDPDARRRAVHDRGRAAVDEMRGDRPSD
jgi:hypothetical protein